MPIAAAEAQASPAASPPATSPAASPAPAQASPVATPASEVTPPASVDGSVQDEVNDSNDSNNNNDNDSELSSAVVGGLSAAIVVLAIGVVGLVAVLFLRRSTSPAAEKSSTPESSTPGTSAERGASVSPDVSTGVTAQASANTLYRGPAGRSLEQGNAPRRGTRENRASSNASIGVTNPEVVATAKPVAEPSLDGGSAAAAESQ